MKCLVAACSRLKKPKWTQYSIITRQIHLRSLVISVCSYNPLCGQIPFDSCLQFDRALYTKYIQDMKHTVTQSAHATLLSHDHHDLHIPSLILTQLQSRSHELRVRLNLLDPTQQCPPLARLVAMVYTP